MAGAPTILYPQGLGKSLQTVTFMYLFFSCHEFRWGMEPRLSCRGRVINPMVQVLRISPLRPPHLPARGASRPSAHPAGTAARCWCAPPTLSTTGWTRCRSGETSGVVQYKGGGLPPLLHPLFRISPPQSSRQPTLPPDLPNPPPGCRRGTRPRAARAGSATTAAACALPRARTRAARWRSGRRRAAPSSSSATRSWWAAGRRRALGGDALRLPGLPPRGRAACTTRAPSQAPPSNPNPPPRSARTDPPRPRPHHPPPSPS
jgi:hypothetical protein